MFPLAVSVVIPQPVICHIDLLSVLNHSFCSLTFLCISVPSGLSRQPPDRHCEWAVGVVRGGWERRILQVTLKNELWPLVSHPFTERNVASSNTSFCTFSH